ncbi:SufD family Fe-S cluster assembly protein [Sphingomonas cavernae]|uniref:SufD family Fe-S cluster assembly protein n=1 Tax=Sphingomonas cavernae TaxID=2320861 RepID=A0A418WQT3_9SPHN|nr:SufD family Fe-S cluster assembly protein [Sphingomonas cavernae]RJF93571.1 SufD family Fe-S cluster assembly protein [Sphingomonas cavernae]
MTTQLPLPTRKLEAWRYSDLDALAKVWPEVPGKRETIAVPAGESITRIIAQQAREGAVIVEDYTVTLGRDARAEFYVLNTGGQFGRITLDVTLAEGAHFEMGGAILGSGTQTLEIVTQVTHAEPGATSHQTVRSVLAGKATGSYLGKILVARDAQKTDAEQSVKAMLLDRTATANAKPELEIYADDVKCAHGATVGELDRQALFYLASRGLPPAEAKKLMLQGFIAGVFDGIEDAAEREAIEAAAIAALENLL